MTCISSYTHLIYTPAAKYKNVFWYSGKIRFIEPQETNGHKRPVPGAPSSGTSRERPGNVQGWDRVGIVEKSCGYRAHGVSIRGKFVLSRNPGYKTRGGGRHVAKRSSDPWVAYPEVNVQVRDLVRVVGIVAPFTPRGFSIRGKFVLSIWQAKTVYPLSSSSKLEAWTSSSKLEAWNMIRSSMRRYHTYPPHKAPCKSAMRRELYADQ